MMSPHHSKTPNGLTETSSNADSKVWVVSKWREMRRLHEQGQPFQAEQFLDSCETELSIEDQVDLVYGEYALRRSSGDGVSPEEFYDRFPKIRELLHRQFALEQVIDEGPTRAEDTHTFSEQLTQVVGKTESPPVTIGKYVIVGELSSGGQATVYRALHPALEQEVIVKVAKHSQPLSWQDSRIPQEAKLLAALNHPNIARVFDLDEWQGKAFLVCEYIRGRTFEQIRQEEPLTPNRAAKWVAEVAKGVEAAHQLGIFHLDIKPANVVCDPNGNPHLIDFGLAAIRDSFQDPSRDKHAICGTLHFMAPEQAGGSNEPLGAKTDVFGLGGLFFYLLTGEVLYTGENLLDILEHARQGRWNRNTLNSHDIPQSLQSICCKALESHPQDRYSSAKELADALHSVASSRKTSPSKWLVVPVLAVVLLGFLIWNGRKPGNLNSTPPSPPGSSEPLTIPVSVEVWNAGQYRSLASVAPVRTGDRMRMQASVPANLNVALFLITKDGRVQRLAHRTASERDGVFRFPSETGKSVPLTGSPGTEILLVCGQQSGKKPIDVELIETWSQRISAWPDLPELTILRMSQAGVIHEQRSRDFGPPTDQPDPEEIVIQQLDDLRHYLQNQVDVFEALAYCHGL